MALQTEEEIVEEFLNFIKNYTDEEGNYKYLDALADMIRDGQRSLEIDFADLHLMDNVYNMDLSSTLEEFPDRAISMASRAVELVVREEDQSYYENVKLNNFEFHARFSNCPFNIRIRDIRSTHLNSFKGIEGIVVRTSEVRPLIVEAVYVCSVDPSHIIVVNQSDGTYSPPTRCSEPTCKSKTFALDQGSSVHIDWQSLTIQEKPEDLPPGTSPKSLRCRVLDDLVDRVRPGDRVQLFGLVRTRMSKPLKKGQQLIFDLWIDTNYIESFEQDADHLEITTEEEAKFQEIARSKDVYQTIIKSIAPQVKGMEKEKEAIMYFLFGGVDKRHSKGFKSRGQPNVLFVGDPGVAKCVTGDSLVKLADGTVIPIEQIIEQVFVENSVTEISDGFYANCSVPVLSMDMNGKVTERQATIAWKRTAPESLYHIRTAMGRQITVTPTHPFFELVETTISSKQAQEIRVGDYIAVPKEGTDSISICKEVVDNFDGSTVLMLNRRTNVVVIPNCGSTLRQIRIDLGLMPCEMGITEANYIMYEIGDIEPPVEDIIRIITHLGNYSHPLLDRLNLVTDADVRWDRVVSVNERESDHEWVYDLQVDETHNFIANGIVVHNSQLLKSVQPIAPRSIYTSGKGSSAAGLTAAISRDPDTGEMTLEAGAMVLADQGVCLTGDTLILLRDGREMSLAEIYASEEVVDVLTFNPHSLEQGYGRVHAVSRRSCEAIYEISFASGDTIRASPEHPFPVWSSHLRWRKSEELVPGDVVIDYRSYHFVGQKTLSHDRLLEVYNVIADMDNTLSTGRDTLLSECALGVYDELSHYDQATHRELAKLFLDTADDHFLEVSEERKDLVRRILRRAGVVSKETEKGLDIVCETVVTSANSSSHSSSVLMSNSVFEIREVLESVYANPVVSVRRVEGDEVFNLQIQGDETYFANYVPVHNCLIDEFDKMNDNDRSAIHEAMEQGTVSIAKAGIVATLNSRTGVLAAANPKWGYWMNDKDFNDNVDLSQPIVSRFDLIFILKDIPDSDRDNSLAEHLLNLHYNHQNQQAEAPPLSSEELRKYIIYAKQKSKPSLTKEAMNVIQDFYVTTRSKGAANEGEENYSVTITARQLEGIIRLAEARARVAMRNQVTEEDANAAIDLLTYTLKQYMLDPETGQFDYGIFSSGISSKARNRISILMNTFKELLVESEGQPIPEGKLIEACVNEGLSVDFIEETIKELLRQGTFYRPKPKYLNRIK